MARIRQSQTTPPLTPSLYQEPTPTPTAVTAVLTLTPEEIAARREDAIEVQVRSNAQIFGLKSELAFEEKLRAQQRQEFNAEYAKLQSRVERLEQDAASRRDNPRLWDFNRQWLAAAETYKDQLLRLVRDGKFCANAAAPPDEIRAEAAAKIERMDIPCQSQTISQ